jgi:hypothetical protein
MGGELGGGIHAAANEIQGRGFASGFPWQERSCKPIKNNGFHYATIVAATSR